MADERNDSSYQYRFSREAECAFCHKSVVAVQVGMKAEYVSSPAPSEDPHVVNIAMKMNMVAVETRMDENLVGWYELSKDRWACSTEHAVLLEK